jgi:hypothetical protein
VTEVLGQEFESDQAAQPQILGPINHSHPAGAQLLEDAMWETVSPTTVVLPSRFGRSNPV